MNEKINKKDKEFIKIITLFSFLILFEFLSINVIFMYLDLELLFIGMLILCGFGSIIIGFVAFIDMKKTELRKGSEKLD